MKLCLFSSLLAVLCLTSASPDASACTTARESTDLPVVELEVPIDGPITVTTSSSLVRINVEVSAEDGTDVPVVMVPAPDAGLRWARPASGAFPEGRLTVVVRQDGRYVVRENIRARGSIADYRLSVEPARVAVSTLPEETSPKIRCNRLGMTSCGPETSSDLPARWHRRPALGVQDHDPPWVKSLFTVTNRWTVRLADGTVEPESGAVSAQAHVFTKIGVEYCFETTRTPRVGIAAAEQSERRCVQDDGSRFAWSDADNDALLVKTANEWGCESLDFPDGVEVPEELEDRAGQSGCTIGQRSVGGRAGLGAVVMLLVGSSLTAAKRRSRSG